MKQLTIEETLLATGGLPESCGSLNLTLDEDDVSHINPACLESYCTNISAYLSGELPGFFAYLFMIGDGCRDDEIVYLMDNTPAFDED